MNATSPTARTPRPAQEPKLGRLREHGAEVHVFLVNGIKLIGNIVDYDDHTILLANGSAQQLVYKHAITTVAPATFRPPQRWR